MYKRQTEKEWRARTSSSRANEVVGPKPKGRSAADAPGSESSYCIGIWNVRSMNLGKLNVVKQEMARINLDVLGILKWMGIQTIIIATTMGKNPVEEME